MPDQTRWPDPGDDEPEDYCEACCNTGEVDCRCLGDLCMCGQPTKPCPNCHGDDLDD